MCPGDGHDRPTRNCLPEGVGAAHDRNPCRPRRLQLRMTYWNGCGVNYCTSANYVRDIMSYTKLDARFTQLVNPVGTEVASRDRDPPAPPHERQRAHPRPCDSHEVDRAEIPRGE